MLCGVRPSDTWQSYYRYWGKAAKAEDGISACHLLPYHSLDVAAVGQALLEQNPGLRKQLAVLAGMDETSFSHWMVFFLALHDLGKFSDSFQNLCPELLEKLQHRTCARRVRNTCSIDGGCRNPGCQLCANLCQGRVVQAAR